MEKKQIKLDKKDKEILFYLDLDARSPLSHIAKKTRLSKQVVKYRIERLVEKGVIEKFLLFINGTKLGYIAYKFYIQLQNIVEEKLNEIVEELKNHPLIVWVATCEGNYDLAIAPIARNNVHAFSILNELLVKYNEYIRDIIPLNYIDVSHMKKVHMTGFNRNQIGAPFWGNEPERYKLDDYEIQILSILSEEARKPITEIAKEIGCSVDIVNNRLKKLLRDGIIQGSTIIMNRSKIGYEYHKILLKIRFYSEKQEKSFLEFVKSEDNITDIIRMMGDWNYELDIEVKNIYEFHGIMLKIRNRFPTNIQSYDSLMILEEHKLNFFPMKNLLKNLIN
ncbi:Lrp/AsnC family transcriptional regulator [Candidatus Woesearchaeota archaeon]|nr:Lrp/AsnC family transcriptional regulator [Candidatus Woesearchaeota archaeon]